MFRSIARRPVVLAAASLAMATLAGEGGDADQKVFHDAVMKTYDFLPRNLEGPALTEKSAELDGFWSMVESRGDVGLRLLRTELQRTDAPVFFNFDGAKLLLSLSKGRSDRSLALAAITRSDLRDIQSTEYLLTVHFLAVEGYDTTEAAFKILAEPRFQALIPAHALTLNQEACLAFMLLPTDDALYLQKAIDRLFVESETTAQKSLISLLASTVTEEGDKAISRFASDAAKTAESRDFAAMVLKSIGVEPGAPWKAPKSYKELKMKQKKALSRVSDEAMYEFQEVQRELRSKAH